MRKFEDLSGQQFGLWTVLNRDESKSVRTRFLCRCACGTLAAVQACNLKQGVSKSCGCDCGKAPCGWCKKEFTKVKGRQRYCSPVCAKEAQRNIDKEKRKARNKNEKTCFHCGKVFTARVGNQRYCSGYCSVLGRCTLNTSTGCLEWKMYKNELGYGVVGVKGKASLAHRVVYEGVHGTIPEGMLVCHRCDNPKCCNPEHLWLGTNEENIADMKAKGRARGPVGEKNKNAKLTEVQVLEIRANTTESQEAIAQRYGVSQVLVSKIKRGGAWSHLSRKA